MHVFEKEFSERSRYLEQGKNIPSQDGIDTRVHGTDLILS